MSALYQDQRTSLIAALPALERLLPDHPPTPPAIPALEHRQLRALLRAPANNHASQVLVVGWGDGSVPLGLLGDPLCRQKRVHVLLLPGEERAFASSLLRPALAELSASNLKISQVDSAEAIGVMIVDSYNFHEDIPPLCGCDFIDRHPLMAEAEAYRAAHLAEIYTKLSDQPQTYGNDISDSFTGLHNAAANAATLLPAPPIGDMAGFFGGTPVISIAAGPSLKRHLPRLRELQDRCILVACDAVLHGLLDQGIDPHFVTPLERIDLIKPMLTRAGESRCVFAGLPVVSPAVVARFGPERALGLYCGDRLYDWLLPGETRRINTGLSTGVLSVTVAAALGSGPVYLVGHDLARDRHGSHWDGAGYASDAWKKVKDRVDHQTTTLSGYETRLVPGNDGGVVEAIVWWDRFRSEIAYEARRLASFGRRVYNVNAHDRVHARIDHTLAAPLPDPASLPKLAPWRLPARDPARLRQWQERARELPADGRAFTGHLAALRADLAAAMRLPPDRWQVDDLAKRLDLCAAVSPGNRMAFSYFLRSALHNCTAEMHLRRRTASAARSRWAVLQSMDQLSQALANATARLQPVLEEIAREHT